MDYIDVVNEPLHAPPSYTAAMGGAGSTGWDWVIWSYEKARQYCGNSELLLNDYDILNDNNNTTSYLEIINLLKDRGLIDGIGVQCHGFENTNISTIIDNLDRLADTGLPIYVSEYEVQGDDNTQLSIYQEGSCGGSYSEMMQCGGYILFDTLSGGATIPPTDTPTPTPAATLAPTPTPDPTPTPGRNLGDVNNSGSVDIVDALLIAQRYVGLITTFPC